MSPGLEEGKASAEGGGSITEASALSSWGPWQDMRGKLVGGAVACVGEQGRT